MAEQCYFIWGFGGVGRRSLKYLMSLEIIKGIIDSDVRKQGMEYQGLRVRAYNREEIGDCGIIIASFFNNSEIEDKLKTDGVPYWHIKDFLAVYFASKGKNAIPFLDLKITNRCTLKCKNCMQYIPYIEDKQDFDVDILETYLNLLLKQVNFIGEISIIGGEPFMHKNLAQIIEIVSQDKAVSVVITTNGMVIPNAEVLEACRQNNVFVSISDYSKTIPSIEPRITEFQRVIKGFGIECERKLNSWSDPGTFSHECSSKMSGCYRTHMQLIGSQLWHCTLQAGGFSAKICDGIEGKDYIDLNAEYSAAQMRDIILQKVTSVCHLCKSKSGVSVVPAEQM